MNSTLSVTAITYYRVLQKLSIAAEKHNPKAPHAASTTFFPAISDYRTAARRSFSFPAWAMDAPRIAQDSLFNMEERTQANTEGRPPATIHTRPTSNLEPQQRKA